MDVKILGKNETRIVFIIVKNGLTEFDTSTKINLGPTSNRW